MVNNHNKYKNHSREELIDELETLKKKKYGLIWDKKNSQEILDTFVNWENVPENFAPKQFPVLKEVKNKEIRKNKNKPVNLLIEGDNYHSLAVLNFTHRNKIDVIYIDPPYNTGNKDFIYNDKFIDKEDSFRHSKWLSFMDKRLRLAQKLLKNIGVLFISIDDNEMAQLKLLCDEIFGEKNFIALFPRSVGTVPKTTEGIQIRHDYVLCYAKENLFAVDIDIAEEHFKFDDNNGRGIYALIHPLDSGTIHYSRSLDYPIQFNKKTYKPGQHIKNKPEGKWLWRWGKDLVKWGFENNLIVEKNNRLYTKNYRDLKVKKVNGKYQLVRKEVGKPFTSDTLMSENFGNRIATREIKDILPNSIFTYPKPSNLVKKLITMVKNNKSAIILDFFVGSGTTGQAVLELNKEDKGNRKFILCTNNENNICSDVCYPRVERIINGYKNSRGEKVVGLGGNLKYFKTDFVGSDSTDKNKRDLVNKSAEMICIKEDIFDLVADGGLDYKIYQKGKKFLGIIFDLDAIANFKKEAEKHKGNFVVYCFSYTEATPEKEFKGFKNKYVLKPIPAVILRIYLEIFKK